MIDKVVSVTGSFSWQASLFIGCQKCGSPVDHRYSRTQEKTRQCILVQVVEALCLAVGSSLYSRAPK